MTAASNEATNLSSNGRGSCERLHQPARFIEHPTFATAGNKESNAVRMCGWKVFRGDCLYYPPTLEGTSQLLCPGDSALVEVIPDPDENFVDFVWVENWNGGGGQVLSSDGGSAYVTPGLYQVVVSDEEGCDGKRTFAIGSTSTIPDQTIDPLCGAAAFDPVTFDGGYSSLGQGYLQLQLFTLNVEDRFERGHRRGRNSDQFCHHGSGGFANGGNEDLAIAFGDEVQITYVSNNQRMIIFQFNPFQLRFKFLGNPMHVPDRRFVVGRDEFAPASHGGTHLGNVGRSFWTGNNSFTLLTIQLTWSATALLAICASRLRLSNQRATKEVNGRQSSPERDSVLWVCDEVTTQCGIE